ncbi:hypothetical protein B0H11DRAFT_1899704 [Mycena galericulata]|nr:hypothetical protein B0H11DRAFT_1899704 [Mycena galericulata]
MSSSTTTAPTPAQELAALVAQVSYLSKLGLEMTKHCIDINNAIPRVVLAQVDAAAATNTTAAPAPQSPQFVPGVPRTPAQMEALHPPGTGDQQPWYVVWVGREPGLYATSAEADAQVNGVPGQFRRKKDSLHEAQAFYRLQYNSNAVAKLVEAPVPAAAT